MLSFQDWNNLYDSQNTSWRLKDWDIENWVKISGVRGGNAIDLGTGSGETATWLSEHGFDTEGIDFSESAINIARGTGLNASFSVWDLENLSQYTFKHTCYDLILDLKVLAFISDKEKYLDTIKSKLCGVFILQVFHYHDEVDYVSVSKDEIQRLIEPRFDIINTHIMPTREGKEVAVYFLKNK